MIEHWITIEEFPEYMVSNLGRIWSSKTDRILQPGGITNSGYLQAHFRVNGIRKVRYIHRLVAAAFFDFDITGYEIDHLNYNKHDNAIWNLEIVTPSENSQRAYDTGRRGPPSMKRVRIIETGDEFDSITDCGRYLNRTVQTVSGAIIHNRRVAGYHVEYIERSLV